MIFKRRTKRNQKINEDFITENAEKIKAEDVEKVIRESSKIKSKLENNGRFDRFIDEGKTMLSLIKDYWKKDYQKIPWYALTAIVFALLYVLNPMDLSPDYIPFIGYLDDVSVFSFALTLVSKDLTAYKEWKDQQDEIN
jgi:uncharacterized membrane protein YkvA (DUF1232 family)